VLDHIQDRPTEKPCVIVITAYQSLVGPVQSKADLVFLKPVSYSQLREIARALMPRIVA